MVNWLRNSVGESIRPVLVVGTVATIVLAGAVSAAVAAGLPPGQVVVDPAVAETQGRLVGVVSLAGVLLWSVSATIAFFTATLLTGRDRELLLAFGAISVWLAVDDQFMVHEATAEVSDVPGANQAYLLVYGAVLAALAVRVRRALVGPHLIVLLLAVALLASSLVADLLADTLGLYSPTQKVIEDSLKFVGICYWATFAVLRSRDRVLVQRPMQLDAVPLIPAPPTSARDEATSR